MPPGESTTATAPPPKPPRFPRLRRAGRWAATPARAFWAWERRRLAVVRDPAQPRGRRVSAAALGLAGAGVFFGAALVLLVALYAVVLLPFLPGVGALRQARELHPSVVLSADGEELTRYARNDREWVGLDEVSPHVLDALIATEDRRFYAHGGIDLRRTVGAVVRTLSGDREGGSTITQQLARNLFPDEIGTHRSLTRKLKEALTALKIEGVYTKDEILEIYLNTVPFLYNAFGIERAAETYFGTSAADLSVTQAATLVGMLKGTSFYNPVRNPERALARRNLVMRLMVRDGHLTQAEYDALEDDPLGVRFTRPRPYRSRAGHFTEYVRRWLVDWADANGYNAYGDGLVVHTTLDLDLQRAASEAVIRWGDALQAVADVEWGRASSSRLGTTTAPYERAAGRTEAFAHFWETRDATVDQFVRESAEYRAAVAEGLTEEAALDSLRADDAFMDALREVKTRLDVGFVAIDPATGYVRAWVGSRNFRRTPFDHVADARRQPGSTFKPFLYARALLEGWRPDDTLPDDTVSLAMGGGEVWRPTNADGTVSGEMVTLRDALARSTNTVSARLIQEVGARDVARTARAMGVDRSRLRPVPSLALGTSEVSLLEMAAGYATIAAAGVRRPPVWVTRIEDREGNVVAEFAPPPRQVLDPDVGATLIDMMRGVVTEGTGRGVTTRFGVRGDLAGKTGTSQGGADGWFFLMHPELVAGAWVGFDDPRVAFRSSYWGEGAHNALLVVGSFFQRALRRDLVAAGATFPEAPEDLPPSLLDRAVDWIADLFEVRVERDEDGAPYEDDAYEPDEPYVAERPAPRARDVEPPDLPGPYAIDVPPLDSLAVAARARRAAAEALREAARRTDEVLDDPPTTPEEFEALAREAEALARELEALELERAEEVLDDLKRQGDRIAW